MKKLASPIEIIKKSIHIFFEQKNITLFLKVYSPLALFTVIMAIQQYLTKTNYPLSPWVSGVFVIVNLVFFVSSFLIGIAGIYVVSGVVAGKYYSFKEIYSFVFRNIWKYLLLSFLIFLIVFGGLILLIIPGIIFSIWFVFSRYIILERNTGVVESLFKSKALVKGRFWKVFGRLFVFGLFFVLIQVVMVFLPFSIGSILNSFIGALFILPSYLLFKELE